MNEFVLNGKIVSGARKATFFTQIQWVKKACLATLGFEPFPGTLNIALLPESQAIAQTIAQDRLADLAPPDAAECAAKTLPVFIDGIGAAILFPEKKVRVHGSHILEVIAPVNLKHRLNKTDGEVVTITVDSSWFRTEKRGRCGSTPG